MRTFNTGATRDSDETKPDYEGFLSPLVIVRFGVYMNKHRVQADGGLRDSDNWQKGIPTDAYMKSAWRHFLDVWLAHRLGAGPGLEDALCALLFNVQGYLHELLKRGAYGTVGTRPSSDPAGTARPPRRTRRGPGVVRKTSQARRQRVRERLGLPDLADAGMDAVTAAVVPGSGLRPGEGAEDSGEGDAAVPRRKDSGR